MRWWTGWITFAMAAGAMLPSYARAANDNKPFKYAYVEMERVLDEYVLFEEARRDAQSKIKEAQVNDKAKLQDYQDKIEALAEKLRGPLAPAAQSEAEAQYNALVQEAMDFRDDAISHYKKIEAETYEPVYKKVYDKIASYAQRNNYEMVFDYTAVVLYADTKNDITSDVIKELNEEAGVSPKP